MVGTVPRSTVTVPVTIVTGQKPHEGGGQIDLGPRSQLHEGDAGRGVGHEHRAQSIATPLAEIPQGVREIDDLTA